MFYFRIDLSSKHGLGHYHRAKALIRLLNIKKYKIIVDKIPENIFFRNKKNFDALYSKNTFFHNEADDAKLFLKVIKNKRINVVKDSYRLGYIWEKKIYNYCNTLTSISDCIQKKNYVDYYLNYKPNLTKNSNSFRIIKKNNRKNTKYLLGIDYALFNSTIKGKFIKSDLVFYNGGSGNILIYEKIIKILAKKKYKIILIVGPLAKNYNYVIKKFNSKKNIKIIYQPKNILNILKGTKLFISSAGISMLESSFLKIPSLLFKMNINQNLNDQDYEQLGHYYILSKNDLINFKKIAKLIILMLNNNRQLKRIMYSKSLCLTKIKKKLHIAFKNCL